MKSCIFSAHCTEPICDLACPSLVETTYLLERNGLDLSNSVFNSSSKQRTEICNLLDKLDGKLTVIESSDTITLSNLITYCAICKHWKGNRLHCNIYHLKFSNHLDAIQQSWNTKDIPENLEYEQIWSSTAKILVISNIDYVQFKEFQSQTLLNLIHNRLTNNLSTIIVSPKLNTLIGTGMFFNKLQSMLRGAVVSL